MKENDWIVAGLTNPQYSTGDFKSLGMSLDNTLMLTKDLYLKSDYIKNNNAFKDENGEFSLAKFDEFYNKRLNDFNNFKETLSLYAYDLFDYRRFTTKNQARIKDPGFNLYQITNPDEKTIGNGWINLTIESPLSDRERAEKSKVYDFENKLFLEYSPNDHTLFSDPIEWFKDIFREPLVLATWDDEGDHIDPLSKLMVHHVKGEKKVNDEGKYYYETLNGRNLAGKEVLSGFDTLTVDGSLLNKVDFFDSDDREKSIGGTLMKTAAGLLPLFIGGPVGVAYSAALVGRELTKALPMIDGFFGTITGNSLSTAFSRLANNLAGKAMAGSSDISDYGKEKLFSTESLSNILEDVALLWGQQKVIAEGIKKLRGVDKLTEQAEASAKKMWEATKDLEAENLLREVRELETAGKVKEAATKRLQIEATFDKFIGNEKTWKESRLGKTFLAAANAGVAEKQVNAAKLGAAASLSYMAAVSNADLYNEMLNYGCTKREAFIVALASSLGMYLVDTKLHLGEIFFNDLTDDSLRVIRNTLKNEAKNWAESIKEINANKELSKLDKFKSIFLTVKESVPKVYEGFWEDLKTHSLGTLGKAIGEGLEEVSEDIVQDLAKLAYEWSHAFLDTTTDNVNAFDDAFNSDDWFLKVLSRYSSDFLGGFLGGAVFDIKEKIHDKSFKHDKEKDNLLDMLMDSNEEQVMEVLDEYHKKGKLGSTKLGVAYEMNEDGNPVFLSSDKGLSQNDFIYNQLKYTIHGLAGIIKSHELYRTGDETYTLMTLGEKRYEDLLEDLGGKKSLYAEEYRARYTKLFSDLIRTELNIKDISDKLEKTETVQDRGMLEKQLAKLELLKSEQEEKIQNFTSGENALDYMQMRLFSMDKLVSSPFKTLSFIDWLSKRETSEGILIPMTYEEFTRLTPAEQKNLRDQYLSLNKNAEDTQSLEDAWTNFKGMMKYTENELAAIDENYAKNSKYVEKIKDLFNEEVGPFRRDKVVSETDFTEDAEDEALRIDLNLIIASDYAEAAEQGIRSLDFASEDEYKAAVLSFIINNNKHNTAVENDELFAKKILRRRAKVLKAAFEKYLEDETLQILGRVEEYLTKAGNIVDSLTKRKLLLQLSVRKKDILKLAIKRQLLLSAFDPETKQAFLKAVEGTDGGGGLDLNFSNLEELKDLIASNIEKTEEETIKKSAKAKIELLFRAFSNLKYEIYTEDEIIELSEGTPITKTVNPFVLPTNLREFGDVLNEILSVGRSLSIETSIYTVDATGKVTINLTGLLNLLNSRGLHPDTLISSLSEIKTNSELVQNEGVLYKVIANSIFNEAGELDFTKLESLILLSLEGAFNLRILQSPDGGLDVDYDFTEANKELFSTVLGGTIINLLSNSVVEDAGKRTMDWSKVDHELFYIDVERNDNIYSYSLNDVINPTSGILIDQNNVNITSFNNIKDLSNFEESLTVTKNLISTGLLNIKRLTLGDRIYKYIDHLESLATVENPITPLLKKLSLFLNRDFGNIETLLNSLLEKLIKTGFNDFVLSPEEHDALNEAYDLLTIAQALIVSSAVSKEVLRPYPHNQLYNELLAKHGLKLDKLPEISQDSAYAALSLIALILGEIGHMGNNGPDEYSWRWWDKLNSVNKAKLFSLSKLASQEARLNFWETYKDSFVAKLPDGRKINLLLGINGISSAIPTVIRVAKIEQLFYNNFNTLLEQEKCSAEELLSYCSDLSKNINTLELIGQTTSIFSKEYSLDKMTSMDRIMYLFKCAAVDVALLNAFDKLLIDQQPDKAFLEELSYLIHLGLAYTKNPEMYDQFLEYAYKLCGYSVKIPKISAMFISGNGGAGKSDVVIRSYLTGINGKALVSGPSKLQVDALSVLHPNITAVELDDMFVKLLGEDTWNSMKEEIEANKENPESAYFDYAPSAFLNFKPNFTKRKPVCKKGITFKDNPDIKAIIIDEGTHYSRAKLSILAEYCRQKNIPFFIVGDDLQTGAPSLDSGTDPEGIYGAYFDHINPEVCFTGRTPRLGITLRDGNVLKLTNNNILADLSYKINACLEEDTHLKNKLILQFNKLLLSYYKLDELNGDYFTDTLTEQDVDQIKKTVEEAKSRDKKGDKKHTVVYVGSTASASYTALKNEFGEELIHFDDTKDVLGYECDVIVINKPYKTPTNFTEVNATVHDIYTLSTRGRVAAVFVGSGLLNTIKNVENSFKNNNTNFNDDTKRDFNDSKNSDLEVLDKTGLVDATFDFAPTEPTTTSTPGPTVPSSTAPSSTAPTGAHTYGAGGAAKYSGVRLEGTPSGLSREPILSKEEVTYEENYMAAQESLAIETLEKDAALCYGAFSLRGCKSGINPKTGEVQYYDDIDYQDPKNNVLKDVGAMMGSALINRSSTEPSKYFIDKLLAFKGRFLFSGAKNRENNFKDLFTSEEAIDYNIDYEDWKKNGPVFKIVVVPRDPERDEFIGYSELDTKKMEIGPDKYIYKIVVEYQTTILKSKTDKTPLRALITLGAMSNPETFNKAVETLYVGDNCVLKTLKYKRGLLTKRASDLTLKEKVLLKSYDKRIARLENLAKSNILLKESYLLNFTLLTQRANEFYKRNSLEEYSEEIADIEFSAETTLRYIVQNEFDSSKKRLSGFNTGDDPLKGFETWNDFKTTVRHHFPYAIFSDVHIEKNTGKAVVFVTTDPTFKDRPDTLALNYDNKKIKMIRLDNLGVSVALLATYSTFGKAYRSTQYKLNEEGKKEEVKRLYPFSVNFAGARLLAGLWNYRATLLLFNDHYKSWRNSKGYTDAQIKDTLIQMHELYKVLHKNDNVATGDLELDAREVLNKLSGKTREIAEAIINFNADCAKTGKKNFRLGVGNINKTTGVRNEFLIRKIFKEGDPIDSLSEETYEKDIYGLYLTPLLINSHLANLDSLFRNCIDKLVTINNSEEDGILKTDIRKEITFKDKEGLLAHIKPNPLLENILKNSKFINGSFTLGMSDNFATFSSDEEQDAFSLGDLLGLLPNIINRVTARSLAFSKLEERDEGGTKVKGFTRVKVDKKTSTSTEKFVHWDYDKSSDILIKAKPTKDKNGKVQKGRTILSLGVRNLVEKGEEICDMFSLIFHGTTDEFIDRKLYGAPIINDNREVKIEIIDTKKGTSRIEWVPLSDLINDSQRSIKEGFNAWKKLSPERKNAVLKMSKFVPLADYAIAKQGFLVDPRAKFVKEGLKPIKIRNLYGEDEEFYLCDTLEFFFGTSACPDPPKFKILFKTTDGKLSFTRGSKTLQEELEEESPLIEAKSYKELYSDARTLESKLEVLKDNLSDAVVELRKDDKIMGKGGGFNSTTDIIDREELSIYNNSGTKTISFEFNILETNILVTATITDSDSGDKQYLNGYIDENGLIKIEFKNEDFLESWKENVLQSIISNINEDDSDDFWIEAFGTSKTEVEEKTEAFLNDVKKIINKRNKDTEKEELINNIEKLKEVSGAYDFLTSASQIIDIIDKTFSCGN